MFENILKALAYVALAVGLPICAISLAEWLSSMIGTPATASLLSVAIVTLTGLWAYWRYYLSIDTIGPNQRGVMLRLGEPISRNSPDKKPYQSGPVFVPWFPLLIGGRKLYEIVKIPTDMLPLGFEFGQGEGAAKVWSSDHQRLLVEATLFTTLPYNDETYLIKMIEAGVPLEDGPLTKWIEDKVLPALRQVISVMPYKEAITRLNLAKINTDVNTILRDKKSMLVICGLFGKDPNDDKPGTGQAFMEIEDVVLTDKLQEKLESVETAKLDVLVADETAKVKQKTVGGPIDLMMEKWLEKQWTAMRKLKGDDFTLAETIAMLVENGSYDKQRATYKDLILADSDDLTVDRIEVGSPDGSPIEGDLGSIVAALGAWSRLGKGDRRTKSSKGNQSKGEKKKKGWTDKDEDEIDKDFKEDDD